MKSGLNQATGTNLTHISENISKEPSQIHIKITVSSQPESLLYKTGLNHAIMTKITHVSNTINIESVTDGIKSYTNCNAILEATEAYPHKSGLNQSTGEIWPISCQQKVKHF